MSGQLVNTLNRQCMHACMHACLGGPIKPPTQTMPGADISCCSAGKPLISSTQMALAQ